MKKKETTSISQLLIIGLFVLCVYGCENPVSPTLLPELTTTEMSLITEASAQSGGFISSDAGYEITERGVCWSLIPNPTIADSITKDAAGTGRFISIVKGLTPNTTYYLRAYATSKKGTAYGLQETFTTKSLGLTTKEITDITINSAISGGIVAVSGDSSNIISRGVCWSTNPNPTIQNFKTIDDKGSGAYGSTLTDLTINTTYFVRSYVINSGGTYYGNELSFKTRDGVVSLTTTASTSITINSATSGGNIADDGGATVTARGVCWSTSPNPTVSLDTKTSNGVDVGSFTSSIADLNTSTTYYVRAYATNSVGTYYGNEESFKTRDVVVNLTTTATSSITNNSAISGGNVADDGGATVTARGVCWSTSPNPTVSLSTKTSNGAGVGSFTSSISGLNSSTTYYVRAYVTNSVGTYYGNEESFKTRDGVISITTTATTSITNTSSISGGNIANDGGATVSARGVCWSTSPNPTVSLSTKTSNGTGVGSFTSSITGLNPSTTYYVRAYATNSVGTYYGNEESFITRDGVVSLTTTASASITINSAISGGNIANDGGAKVSARGVCWSTSPNPTVNLSTKTSNGAGLGTFTSSISGLYPSTTYYVRAYATNSVGTYYGNEESFKTKNVVVSITTAATSSIKNNSAISGGNIADDGGATVAVRGVCWSTSPNPTVSLSTKTSNGAGVGSFTSSITGLNPTTTYYVRAYLTNSFGTYYGNEESFTTPLVNTVTSPTGRIWMDRNLGASRVATSSADSEASGDLYQWGRDSDGHEKRTSLTTSTLSTSDTPAHGNFITVSSGNYDWRSPQNNDLWQGVNGTNNPCPEGFRIPTTAEWQAEFNSWSFKDLRGAFASPLKLPLTGSRRSSNGSINDVDTYGFYWSCTVYGTYARTQYINSSSANNAYTNRADGLSVRCLKNE